VSHPVASLAVLDCWQVTFLESVCEKSMTTGPLTTENDQ